MRVSCVCTCVCACDSGESKRRADVPAGDVSLVSDEFSLVRRVGGPDSYVQTERTRRTVESSVSKESSLSFPYYRGIRNPLVFVRARHSSSRRVSRRKMRA